MSKTIELDVDLEKSYGYESGPITSSLNNPHYPEFSFTEDEPCNIPDEGELTIQFRLVRHATDTTNPEKPRYSYTICVKKLISAEGEKSESPTRRYNEAGDALDALAKEKSKDEGEY
jgi:hypothetical protein